MTHASSFLRSTCAIAAVLASTCAPSAHAATFSSEVAGISVYATGFNNPRGLRFGPDGLLYVAEGGNGGSNSTAAQCTQVVAPVGPYTGSQTGSRISRVLPSGWRETVTDNLPSTTSAPAAGADVLGVGDISFIGHELYAVLAGAGCSHGVVGVPNGVVAVHQKTGKYDLVADLSAYQMANPTQHENPADYEPDGVWYSMVTVGGALYAVEPNHGELDRIGKDGSITRIADISATQGHVVPAAAAWYDGAFYVAEYGVYPIVAGSVNVLKITMDGTVTVAATGFSDISGLTFDATGQMYVLENTTGNAFPTPNTGDVVRVDLKGNRKVIAAGLNVPTYLLYDEGSLYVSIGGFGLPATGLGEVDRIRLK